MRKRPGGIGCFLTRMKEESGLRGATASKGNVPQVYTTRCQRNRQTLRRKWNHGALE